MELVVLPLIVLIVGTWFFRGRSSQCKKCGARKVTAQIHKLTCDQIRDDWQHIAPQPDDSVTGPAGMGATIVLERPNATIFQPMWLFGDPESRVWPGLDVDRLTHSTCKRCGHQTIEVSSRVQPDHPEIKELHDKTRKLACTACGGSVKWHGDLWSDEDTMEYYEYGIVVMCRSCRAQFGANCGVTELTAFDE